LDLLKQDIIGNKKVEIGSQKNRNYKWNLDPREHVFGKKNVP